MSRHVQPICARLHFIRNCIYITKFWINRHNKSLDGHQFWHSHSFGSTHSLWDINTRQTCLDLSYLHLGRSLRQGMVYDIFQYITTPNAILKPGITMSSTTLGNQFAGRHLRAISGVAVVDAIGKPFIIIPSRCVKLHEKVYHFQFNRGNVLGTTVDELEHTDIPIVQLQSGLRYVNEIFSTVNGDDGVLINGISSGYPPVLCIGDNLTTNNPYTGFCEEIVVGVGALLEGSGSDDKWIRHHWSVFEKGGEPMPGCCGSAILDEQNRRVSFFRFLEVDGRAVSVAARVLGELNLITRYVVEFSFVEVNEISHRIDCWRAIV